MRRREKDWEFFRQKVAIPWKIPTRAGSALLRDRYERRAHFCQCGLRTPDNTTLRAKHDYFFRRSEEVVVYFLPGVPVQIVGDAYPWKERKRAADVIDFQHFGAWVDFLGVL